MTNIELMRRAAKAAGIELDVWQQHREDGSKVEALRYRGAPHSTFDPLASDADAFQVQIGAEILVQAGEYSIRAEAPPNILFNLHYTGDRAAATRKAIVEVAAVLA
ncbi:hypothetical protein BN2476_830032 [Paraburkholderia piptadeniae]|uniref:Uncharacterized protein n=1 Tax=Paraburkholderia piptadeniae TaxID=1701573 RepID=A0A1N7SSL9_9BURK|nr:hypothetical protein [Paraburkholderia piptadeniae]SIT50461.1 hypothetical protein BN2476_830032 [Paraburkholderia piptadeniae]